jgi:Fic family protein
MGSKIGCKPLPNFEKAIFMAKRHIAGIVYDIVALEGSPYTFPEVQTLLEGITVGGYKLSDQDLVVRQAKSWKKLIHLVERKQFEVNKETACLLHGIVARDEAPKWGAFRTGQVNIEGSEWTPPKAEELEEEWVRTLEAFQKEKDVHIAAISLFLDMARAQLFWDGNKRTARLMMNGVLLAQGYEAISVPAKRRLEFHQAMVRFYDGDQKDEMLSFMLSCAALDLEQEPLEVQRSEMDDDEVPSPR